MKVLRLTGVIKVGYNRVVVDVRHRVGIHFEVKVVVVVANFHSAPKHTHQTHSDPSLARPDVYPA